MNNIIVGISGASGFIYGIKILELLKELNIKTHLIISEAADITREYETNFSYNDVAKLATYVYDNNNIGSCIASGSFKTNGMIIAPCSVHTMSSLAYGITDCLLTRAADVTLKERRKLVLMLRETPLHIGHIKSMAAVTEAGGIIYPPVPAFYSNPRTVDDIVINTAARILDLFGYESPHLKRWATD